MTRTCKPSVGPEAVDDTTRRILMISLTRLAGLAREIKEKKGAIEVSGSDSSRLSRVVAIRRSGTNEPLFLMHPVGGSVMQYHLLAKHLAPEQPVFAIENQVAFGCKGETYPTIEEMASHYIEDMCQVRPRGPYILGGYSMGGLLAFETARQLSTRATVSLVILIDSPAQVMGISEMTVRGTEADGTLQVQDLTTAGQIMAAGHNKKWLVTKGDFQRVKPEARLSYFIEILKELQIVPPHVDASLVAALLTVVRNNEYAQRKYVAADYSGRVLLLRAVEESPELKLETGAIYDEPTFGWQKHCSQKIRVERVPGAHLQLLNEKNIQVVASVMQRNIEQCQRKRAISAF